MNAVFFALVTYLSWGVGDVTIGLVSRRINAVSGAFWGALFRFILYMLMLPLFLKTFVPPSIPVLGANLLAGVSSALGYIFFMQACKYINPALVAVTAGSWGILSTFASLIFLGERLTFQQTLATGLIFLGLLLVSFTINLKKLHISIGNKGLQLALLALVSWSVCGVFLKFPAQSIGWYWTTFIFILPSLLLAPLIKLRSEKLSSPFKMPLLLYFILFTLFNGAGDIGYSAGLATGQISVVAPIAGSYATLSTLLAYFIFKEPVSTQQKVGILISLVGIVAASFYSV